MTKGNAFGPRFRASHRAAARLALTASIAIAVTGCDDGKLAWYQQPNDPQVYAYVFDRCLNSTSGPQTTRYNDWDEAINACQGAAEKASRYCPPNADCMAGNVSHADVRAVLPTTPNAGER